MLQHTSSPAPRRVPLAPLGLALAVGAAVTAAGCFDFDRLKDINPGDVTGTAVTDDGGDPVAFARIAVAGSSVVRRAGVTGDFVARGLPAGAHLLAFQDDSDGDGFADRGAHRAVRLLNFTGASGPELSAVLLGDVALVPAGEVSGVAVDEAGAPVAGAVVVVVRAAADLSAAERFGDTASLEGVDFPAEASVTTDDTGAFLLPAVVPGAVRLVVIKDGAPVLAGALEHTVRSTDGDDSTADNDVGEIVLLPVDDALPVQVELVGAGAVVDDLTVEVLRARQGELIATQVGPSGAAFNLRLGVDVYDVRVRDNTGRDVGGAFGLTSYPREGEEVVVWRVLVGELAGERCDQDDLDGDELKALPATLDAAAFAACADACTDGLTVRGSQKVNASCTVDGVAYDCNDDGDDVLDPLEPACLGACAQSDADGDNLCVGRDDNPCCSGSCPAVTCRDITDGPIDPPPPPDGPEPWFVPGGGAGDDSANAAVVIGDGLVAVAGNIDDGAVIAPPVGVFGGAGCDLDLPGDDGITQGFYVALFDDTGNCVERLLFATVGESTTLNVNALAVDGEGRLLVAGVVGGPLAFVGAAPGVTLPDAPILERLPGTAHTFVLRLNALRSGVDALFATNDAAGQRQGRTALPNLLVRDDAIFLAGVYLDDIDVGGTTLPRAQAESIAFDVYAARLDPANLGVVWARAVGGSAGTNLLSLVSGLVDSPDGDPVMLFNLLGGTALGLSSDPDGLVALVRIGADSGAFTVGHTVSVPEGTVQALGLARGPGGTALLGNASDGIVVVRNAGGAIVLNLDDPGPGNDAFVLAFDDALAPTGGVLLAADPTFPGDSAAVLGRVLTVDGDGHVLVGLSHNAGVFQGAAPLVPPPARLDQVALGVVDLGTLDALGEGARAAALALPRLPEANAAPLTLRAITDDAGASLLIAGSFEGTVDFETFRGQSRVDNDFVPSTDLFVWRGRGLQFAEQSCACGDDEVCDRVTRVCVAACQSDDDCADPTPLCDVSSGACTEACARGSVCGSSRDICDINAGQCVASCDVAGESACGAGECCIGGVCQTGVLDSAFLDDVFAFDGTAFTDVTSFGPGRRAHAAVTSEGIVVGGEGDDGLLGDVWRWQGRSGDWLASPSTLLPRKDAAAVRVFGVAGGSTLVVLGGFAEGGVITAQVLADGGNGFAAGPALPRGLARLGAAAAPEGIVVFGGVDSEGAARGETHFFGQFADAWTTLDIAGPPARSDHAMVENPVDDAIYVYGGTDAAGQVLGDLWRFSGSVGQGTASWQQIATGPDLTPRTGASLVVNDDGELFLFGGKDAAGEPRGELWSRPLQGGPFVFRAALPAGRSDAAAFYDGFSVIVTLGLGDEDDRQCRLPDAG